MLTEINKNYKLSFIGRKNHEAKTIGFVRYDVQCFQLKYVK